MELSGGRISAPHPSSTLRRAYASRACRRLPFGAFSPQPQQHFAVREQRLSRALRPRQEWVEDWVRSNDTLVRGLPILVGGASLVLVLVNRAVSGIAAVTDASSSQSRADILTLALSVTDILAGLVGYPYGRNPFLRTWDSITTATCCKSLVVVYGGNCVLQIGVAAESTDGNAITVDVQKFIQGSLYTNAMESKKRECFLLSGS
ncbi:hypothetical protein PR202_ga18787 [Eleusine coracana subsp. coracana]|uniref:Uncharacterized protein n=1 Tax=Eleusine coracana subsp. coracana TaxID=191504 RepID=A0AAV5CSA2_ELECO|nr:hypothetical protein PR202_ga18787 [Eleusine coracana subsp. coracana]